MPRKLTEKIYADRVIKCSCGKFIGRVVMDAQCLILESGLIAFSWFSWQCLCGKNSSWLAPLLPDDAVNPDNLHPDGKELDKLAKKGITRLGFDRYRVRICEGGKEKYIGTFESESAAIDARDAALPDCADNLHKKAQKLGYKAKYKQNNDKPQENLHTAKF